MTNNAAGEKTILMYQGNTLEIAKAMQKEMLGTEKTMIFILGYGRSAYFHPLLLAPDNNYQHLKPTAGKPRTSLSGLRTLVPSTLNPSPSNAASHGPLLSYISAISRAS